MNLVIHHKPCHLIDARLFPDSDIEEGPGTYTQIEDLYFSAEYIASIYPPWIVIPPEDPFKFVVSSNWHDGTDEFAGTVIGGTIYYEVECDVVGTDSMSFGAVKALYR